MVLLHKRHHHYVSSQSKDVRHFTLYIKIEYIFCLISVAPPPKASIPRRNGNPNTNQDLFGSTPFDQPLHSSPFDVSIDYKFDHFNYNYQHYCASVHFIINIIIICMDSLHICIRLSI